MDIAWNLLLLAVSLGALLLAGGVTAVMWLLLAGTEERSPDRASPFG